jgi:intracellular septation protein
MKFFFDLFPIILFFAAYKLGDAYPERSLHLLNSLGVVLPPKATPGIFVATAVAIAATFVQIAWVWLHHRKVDTMLWVSLVLIAVFGGATLVLQDPLFIKWKPTVLYWLFAVVLLVSELVFGKNLIAAMMKAQIELPPPVWRKLNLSWAAFFAGMGALNLYVAYNFSEPTWVNFKLFGFLGIMLVFVLLQGLMLAKYMDEAEKS